MDEWHYQRGGTSYGPLQAAHLVALRDRGALNSATLVRQDGSNVWLPLGAVNFEHMDADASRATSVAVPVTEKPSTRVGDITLAEVYAPPSSFIRVPERLPLTLKVSVGLLVVSLAGQIAEHMLALFLCALALIGLEAVPEILSPVLDSVDGIWPLVNASSSWRSIVFLLLLIFWQGCAFSSLRQMYGDALMEHGPASGFWWVIPIANLFMPLLCMRELRHLSRKRRHVPQVGMPFGPVLWSMQAGLVVGIALKVLLHLRYKNAAPMWENGQMDATTLLIEVLFYAAWLVYFVLLTNLAVGNLRQQHQLLRDECA